MRARQFVVDVSQLCADPVRTGIQRVVRSLIRDLPLFLDVSFVCFDRSERAFRALDALVLNALLESAAWDVTATEVARLIRDRLAVGDLVSVDRGAVLFIPEVFYDPLRLAYLTELRQERSALIAMIVFDFAPYFNPNAYRIERGGADFFIPFLRFIVAATARCFISQHVQDAYQRRIVRSQALPLYDIVNVLGADGLPAIDQGDPCRGRDTVLCVGSFDGKKKQDLVYAAFVASKLPSAGLKLKMLGALPKDLPPQFEPLISATDLTIVDGPIDLDITRAYGTALASVFVGTDEGYGLPAVESLHHGVPIIAYSNLPAIRDLEAGIVRLDDVTVDALTEKLDILADLAMREQLLAEAASAKLPTWNDFAKHVAEWLERLSSDDVERAA